MQKQLHKVLVVVPVVSKHIHTGIKIIKQCQPFHPIHRKDSHVPLLTPKPGTRQVSNYNCVKQFSEIGGMKENLSNKGITHSQTIRSSHKDNTVPMLVPQLNRCLRVSIVLLQELNQSGETVEPLPAVEAYKKQTF